MYYMEKAMAPHSSVPTWEIPQRGAWWASAHGIAKSQTNSVNKQQQRSKTLKHSSKNLGDKLQVACYFQIGLFSLEKQPILYKIYRV